MVRYLILIEPTETGFSAFSPDLPGCVAATKSRADAEAAMRDAMAFHLEGMRDEGLPIPTSATTAAWVEITA